MESRQRHANLKGYGSKTAIGMANNAICGRMKTIRRTRRARDSAPAAGALLVALFLFLYALAASPALHQAIHPDPGNPSHHCAISLLAQGQVDAPVCEAILCPATTTFFKALPPLIPVFGVEADLLPPGRAPPSVFA